MDHGKTAERPQCRGRVYPFPWILSVSLLFFLLFPAKIFSQSDSSYRQGYEQYARNQFDSAIGSFTHLIEAFPEKKEGYYNRGQCYYHLNKFAEAHQDFNACLQTDSVFEDARFMKVLILQRQGDWKSALIEFKKINTNYAGYNVLKKRIQYHNLSVLISRNWYYMIAIMFMFIILVGVIAKTYSVRKG